VSLKTVARRLPLRRTISRIALCVAVVASVSAASNVFNVPAAQAVTQCLTPHCYSVEAFNQSNYQIAGAYGEWDNLNMNPGSSSASTKYHMSSEMWFTLNSQDFIEMGLFEGYEFWSDGSCSCTAYSQFWADTRVDFNPPHQYQHTILHTTPNGTHHTYKIVRGASPNIWKLELDGHDVGTSTILRNWLGHEVVHGGEFFGPSPYTSGSFADNYNMIRKIIDGNGAIINYPLITGSEIDTNMNGTDYGQRDHWYWNKVPS
jgi:hypothetical protein